ncbi:hypothetical protein CVU75_01365 [Candidatus Dependentiae bacterium HGW-Dependentiae-1]|nr:MAG: hypothetical protein CVU75_01365 [Candidatus Dependentiae bacterium HGW-Dependentiae-1]
MNKKISTLALITAALLLGSAAPELMAAHRNDQRRHGNNIVQVRNADKLVFFGKGSVQVRGIYATGPLQQTAYARKPLTFLFKDPAKGQLQRIEIENPHATPPTKIEQPREGIQYNIKFDSGTQRWYIHQEKRTK